MEKKKNYVALGSKCLENYNENKIYAEMKEIDMVSLSAVNLDGMPKSLNKISNPTALAVIRNMQDKDLQRTMIEIKAVELSQNLVGIDSKYILEHVYIKRDLEAVDIYYNLYDKCDKPMSESTYYRRLRELRKTVGKMYEKLFDSILTVN
jgi:phosphate uptake regulator